MGIESSLGHEKKTLLASLQLGTYKFFLRSEEQDMKVEKLLCKTILIPDDESEVFFSSEYFTFSLILCGLSVSLLKVKWKHHSFSKNDAVGSYISW